MGIRAKIIEKANDICRVVGFKAMTMDDIAAQLSISKKTIYQYFPDKDSLVMSIVEKEVKRSENDCQVTMEMSSDAIDEILIANRFFTEDFKDINPIIFHDLEKYYKKSFMFFMEHRNGQFYEVVSSNITRGITEGLYRPEVNVEILTRFRLESVFMAFNQKVFPSNQYNFLEVYNTLIDHFIFGIVTQKGRDLLYEYKARRINNSN